MQRRRFCITKFCPSIHTADAAKLSIFVALASAIETEVRELMSKPRNAECLRRGSSKLHADVFVGKKCCLYLQPYPISMFPRTPGTLGSSGSWRNQLFLIQAVISRHHLLT